MNPIPALPSPTEPVFSSQKGVGLVRCGLPLVISVLAGLSHLVLSVLGKGVQDLLRSLSRQRAGQLAGSPGYGAPLAYVRKRS